MKIYNNVEYKPNFTGSFVKNEHILRAIEKSDDVSRYAFENIFERMQKSTDGYVFELVLEDAKNSNGKSYKGNNAYKQLVLKIFGKTKKTKEKVIDSDGYGFNGVLKQVNKILKAIYNKPVEEITEEKNAHNTGIIRFIDSVEDSDAFQEEIELIKHDDLEQFDSFFRQEELFDKKNDNLVELNSYYDDNDVELCDNIKNRFFDALF